MTGPNPLDYGWWLASRSAGVVSILAVSVSVIIGLMMANGLPSKGRLGLTKRRLMSVHEATAIAGLVAIAVHGLTLLGDSFIHPSLTQIAVPFTLGYRPVFTGMGIIAGWLAVFLGLSFYARRWIGAKRWRSVHRATIAVWALGVIHTLGAGTDASQPWLQAVLLVTGVPIVYLFFLRVLPAQERRSPATTQARSPADRAAAAEQRAATHAPAPAPRRAPAATATLWQGEAAPRAARTREVVR